MADTIQKKRLLRMTVAHYRQPSVSEERFYQWVTEQHAPRAARLHAKNGIEGFSIFFAPKSFREFTSNLSESRGSPWRVRDFDAQVEFLFRDMETFYRGAADVDFQALQAEEGPFISGEGAEISLGWVETYVKEGKVINLDDAAIPTFPALRK
ncbi:hypothetical protein BJY00DRAFT_321339 [Aspergillus carlsbadensis]|nr:hypothetical protein BJY00DRAFT_321339 [Aspergillus carlsbadensis]